MRTNYLLTIAFISSSCFGQSAKDFFFPAAGKNVSVYSQPAMSGNSNGYDKTLVYFKDMGDSASVTTIYTNYKGTIGWKKEVVRLEDSRVSLVNVRSNIYKPQDFEAGEVILLKIPDGGSSISSQTKGSTKQSYQAEFLEIKIDGKERKALKITHSSEMKRSGKKLMSYSDYYVQGIGYYKRTTDDGMQIEILEDQKYDPNPPTTKLD